MERRRPQRKAKSPQERLPRSVSEEVLALEGKFYPGPMGSDNSRDDSRTRQMKARQRRGLISFVSLFFLLLCVLF